jgi:anti-sigma factor RsiW
MQHPDSPTPHLAAATLNAWLDNALDPPARAAAAAHLASCAACAAQLAELQAVFSALDALPEAPIARDLSASVLHAITPRPAALPRRWRIALAAQIAGALAAGGALAAVLQSGQATPNIPAIDPLAPLNMLGAWVSTIAAQQQSLTARVVGDATQLLNAPLFSAGVCLSITGVAWLIGNGALLRGALTTHSGKKS